MGGRSGRGADYLRLVDVSSIDGPGQTCLVLSEVEPDGEGGVDQASLLTTRTIGEVLEAMGIRGCDIHSL